LLSEKETLQASRMFEDGLVGDAKFSKFSNGSYSIGLERSI
jgi:uncharacterized protein (DUF169 family)